MFFRRLRRRDRLPLPRKASRWYSSSPRQWLSRRQSSQNYLHQRLRLPPKPTSPGQTAANDEAGVVVL